MSEHNPLHVEPLRVRQPYDVIDRQYERLMFSDPDTWRQVRQLDRLTALVEPLEGLEVTDLEERVLRWLAGGELHVVAVIANLMHRCREAAPIGGEA